MGKKILIITGSPRKNGNTATVCEWIAEGAVEKGAEVDEVDAARIKYQGFGCNACMGCQKTEEYRCVIKDEASDVIARVPEYDVLVLATPVYFMGFTAQIKILLDRMYSLFKFDVTNNTIKHKFDGVQFALVATAGGDENGGLNVVKAAMDVLDEFIGGETRHFHVPNAPNEVGEINKDEELRARATAFGRELTE